MVLLALSAATAFALGTVLQQKGALEGADAAPSEADSGTAAGVDALRFLTRLFARPVWLLGGVVTAVGGVLNALALHEGTLAGVQALTTLSLVIALPFGVWLTDQRITRAVVLGALAIVCGIILFVTVGSPSPERVPRPAATGGPPPSPAAPSRGSPPGPAAGAATACARCSSAWAPGWASGWPRRWPRSSPTWSATARGRC